MLVTHEPVDAPVTDGAHYFTLDELRLEQDVPATYPDSAVTPNRDLAEQIIENGCGVAFLPRRRVETGVADEAGRVHLEAPLGREVELITDQAGSTWDPAALTDVAIGASTVLGLRWTPGTLVTVTYTHGYESPPARIRRAAMIATKVWTLRGPVDDRATQVAVEGATVNLATPGVLGSITGIPEVDAAIDAYAQRLYVG